MNSMFCFSTARLDSLHTDHVVSRFSFLRDAFYVLCRRLNQIAAHVNCTALNGDGTRTKRGFSMIEVMVAVGILSALAGIGWGTMQEYMPRFRLVRIAKQFRSELVSMRQIAVQTNRETKLQLLAHSGGDCSDTTMWGGSWEMSVGDQVMGSTKWDLLPEDTMEDGVDDLQGDALVSFFKDGTDSGKDVCFQDWGRLLGPTGSNQDAIVFSPRGWLRNPSSDFNTYGYMEFHFVNQDAQRNGTFDVVKVQVSRAGMIRLLRVPKPYNLNQVGTSVTSSVQ